MDNVRACGGWGCGGNGMREILLKKKKTFTETVFFFKCFFTLFRFADSSGSRFCAFFPINLSILFFLFFFFFVKTWIRYEVNINPKSPASVLSFLRLY